MEGRRPLWRQPVSLVIIALALAGVVLIATGRIIGGVGAVSAASLFSAARLLRMQIRAGDDRSRRR